MKRLLPWIGAAVALMLALALYWLTHNESQEDPCAGLDSDVSAAILAEDARSGDALANRAMLQRGACEARMRQKRAAAGSAGGSADGSVDAGADSAAAAAPPPPGEMAARAPEKMPDVPEEGA